MLNLLYPALRCGLFRLDPETAHHLTLATLKRMPHSSPPADVPQLRVQIAGLTFPNPIGLAAGFDKNAEVPDAMLAMGFGFVEVGGVTPLPQPGNPRPRVFRLAEDHSLINRYGLNGEGMEAVVQRLMARARRGRIVGINIGANKDAVDRTQDYATLVKRLSDVASYFSINISSPNTPGLRAMQSREALDDLLGRVMEARSGVKTPRPVFVKIAPDLSLSELDDVTDVAMGRQIDGLIVSNTTVARPAFLKNTLHRGETGGLSGRAVFERSTWMLAQCHARCADRLPLIGVGGIDSGAAAVEKIRAGASLVQLYTGLVYEGPGLIGRIKSALLQAIAQAGGSLEALRGQSVASWLERDSASF